MKTFRLAFSAVLTVAAGAFLAVAAASPDGAPAEVSALTLQPRRFDTNPLIARASSASLGDNINGPSVIRVPAWVQNPKGRYYMYFAHHEGQFIRLAYADDLRGPWTIHEPGALQLQGSGFSGHIASPDVHVDEANHRFLMYYHGAVGFDQYTRLAVSTTGLDFASDAGATSLGNYYFRVFTYRGTRYAFAKNGNAGGELLRSQDGVASFEKGKDLIPSMRHIAVLVRGDLAYLFYSRGGDAPERILFSTLSLTGDWKSWEPSPAVEVIRPVEAYEGAGLPVAPSDWGAVAGPVNQLRDPAVFEEDGRVYLFYSVAGEQGIAAVELEGFAVPPKALLESVAGQTDSAAVGSGATADTPAAWSINVANEKSSIVVNDIRMVPGATCRIYTNSDFQRGEVIGPASIALNENGQTVVYIKVTPGDATPARYYAVTVNRAAPSAPSVTARLSNVSVRTAMAPGQTLIVGVVVGGGARDVLVRAAGPALLAFGLSSAMSDPRLECYSGQTLMLANDDWPASLAPTSASVGAFPFALGSKDAGFVQSFDGARSIQAQGAGAGVVLVEAYGIGAATAARMINVSARNRVGTGDDILIAGFTISGTGTKRLLVRAIGPGLAAFGVSGALVDPKLEIFAQGDRKVAENDDWAPALAATFATVGAFALPPSSRDAALLTTLPPGSYTLQVRGTDGGTGEALVEVYEVP